MYICAVVCLAIAMERLHIACYSQYFSCCFSFYISLTNLSKMSTLLFCCLASTDISFRKFKTSYFFLIHLEERIKGEKIQSLFLSIKLTDFIESTRTLPSRTTLSNSSVFSCAFLHTRARQLPLCLQTGALWRLIACLSFHSRVPLQIILSARTDHKLFVRRAHLAPFHPHKVG